MNDDNQQTLFSGTTATLSGGVDQTVHTTAPDNVEFVMGPDGQMVAIQKEPFVWKQFFIGLIIPILLLLVPSTTMVIVEGIYDSNYDYRSEVVLMTQVNNTTEYTGYFEVPSGYDVDWCRVDFYEGSNGSLHEHRYDCSTFEGDGDKTIGIEIYLERGWDDTEVVGTWTASNGTVYFDDGDTHNSSFSVIFEINNEPEEMDDLYWTLQGLYPICCLLAPLSGIGLAVYGFSAAKKSLGIGALTALAAGPILTIFACIGMMLMYGF